MFKQPRFVSTADLARLYKVSRMTICRWRMAGFLPKPVYASGAFTLWNADEIDQWDEDGMPMGAPDVADRQIAERGAAEVVRMCEGFDGPDPNEDRPVGRHLLDRLERSLNSCSVMVQQADDPALTDRFHLLQAALAAATERSTDGPEATAGS